MPPTAAAARDRISQPALASRIDRIDILRGLSILAVIFHHINLRIRIELTPLGQQVILRGRGRRPSSILEPCLVEKVSIASRPPPRMLGVAGEWVQIDLSVDARQLYMVV